MRLLAPAKINLHLRVGPRRTDGFHPLLSWMTTVALFDTMTLQQRPAGQAGDGTVALTCDMPTLACDERNLVVRVARGWTEHARVSAGSLSIQLEKRIPVGAGLGGGSSDGARVLLGLNQLWKTGRAANDLSAFAALFGSDLPFFFHGPSSVCRGRGEIVTPVPRPQACWALLLLPKLAMPTADVYRRFDELGLGRQRDIELEPPWQAWAQLPSEILLPRLVNDLERPAFEIAPALAELRERIEKMLSRPVRMSGSGCSLFTLFDSRDQASDAGKDIERELNEIVKVVEVSPNITDDLEQGIVRG